jgi:thymidylate kinase
MPKPDLVILLDAPAELVQSRKREVPLAETVRQRKAYLTLVRGLQNGRVVDASQPFERVTEALNDLIIEHLRARTLRRLGVRPVTPTSDASLLSEQPLG